MSAALDFDTSRTDGPHALLARLVGTYAGRARLWFEPGDPVDDQAVEGAIEPLNGGRFVRHTYTTRVMGDQHSGEAIIGCDLNRSRWQVAWVDTFHTGEQLMFSEGPAQPGATRVDVLGSYPDDDGQSWGWRTTLEPTDSGVVVQHANISPDGRETLAVDITYPP
jgi:Protein of unknown function (DUF1579)